MTIQEAIRKLVQDGSEIYCKICTVDAVDASARTVDVSPLDGGAPVLGVNLQANQDAEIGVVLWPRRGSYVAVAFLNPAAAVVVLTEDVERITLAVGTKKPVEGLIEDGAAKLTIDKTSVELAPEKKITLNGGDMEGLVVIGKLTEKLNQLKDEVNALVKTFNAHTHKTDATVGLSGPATVDPPTPTAKSATAFDQKDYENTNITHG